MNRKIFCALIILIFFIGVNSVSAADNVSDILASDNSGLDSEISMVPDEKLGVASTYVVTNETFGDYFTAEGELNDNVSAGSTLDFQGTFTGEAYKVNITKPVNIISSTGDGLFNETGKKDSTGGCFHISSGGSGTNVSDIEFINSAFYVTNASDVSIDHIRMMADMPGVGSGTGFMCVQAGSRFVTIKNSYFENRGTGSSIAVFGYADYCTFEKNEVVINGSSGNAVYITTYVPAKYVGSDPTGNIISNNYIHGGASTFCMALVVAGNNNIIDNNLIDYNGAGGIASQSPTTENNTYTDNVLKGGCSFAAGENSYVAGNIVDGTMTAGSNSEIRDNKMDALSLSKANVVVDGNVIGEYQVTLNENAFNTTMTNNIIFSKVNVNSKNNTIKNNTVEADDEYAIDLYQTTGNVVAYNNLVSNSFAGDAAVNGTENNEVYENGDVGNIVTEDNFFNFFDENGNYIRNFTELFFMGGFDSLVDVITINQSLTIQSIDASLKNMAFCLLGDDIVLNGLELELYDVPVSNNGSAILINGGKGITIENMGIICAYDKTADVYAIHAENAEDLYVFGNTIYFDVATNGSNVNNAVYVLNSSDILLEGNIIHCFIPSCQVPWKEIPPVGWVKFPLSEGLVFDGCSELEISDNEIYLGYNDVVGDYDTIYAIDIKDCQDVDFNDNRVAAYGHSYIYGLYAEADGLKINNNNFLISSDINYANGIEIEASRDAVISNNHLDVTAPSVAYPIYSGMNGGELEADYINNVIDAEADIVYGMELCGTLENVIGNTINVEGNRTTALAVKSKESNIINNTLNALGIDLGNSTTTESFEPMTAAINMVDSSAIIEGNEIYSNSKGIVVEGGNVIVGYNDIHVDDDSVYDSCAITANDAEIYIAENEIVYVGHTYGSTINNAIYLNGCKAALLSNDIQISIPSAYVNWAEQPPASENWVKVPISQGIVIEDCSELDLSYNNIELEATYVVGDYDTIYVIDITGSDNVTITSNNINASGHDYIYGLYIESDDSLVDGNNFTIVSDTNYANAIEIEASEGTVISNNNIDVTSPNVAYPVYSGMNGGDLKVDYIGNKISGVSDIVYGMELCGSLERVINSSIVVTGNKTTALAVKSKGAHIFNNTIYALGDNLGNSTTTDFFTPMTVAINLLDSDVIIDENNIFSSSKGIVAQGGIVLIENNDILVEDYALDDSYGVLAEDSHISIIGNEMLYLGSTKGSTINNAVKLKDCDAEITENNIEIFMPSAYVNWVETPPGSGYWAKAPITEGLVFDGCDDLVVNSNNISLNATLPVGMLDTIYVMDIIDSDAVNVTDNIITALGHDYIYGLYIESDNATVKNNLFTIKSDTNYANAIEVESSKGIKIADNVVDLDAPNFAYGIYSGMNGGDLNADYAGNLINATADIVYGMELCGSLEKVYDNLVVVNGNKTTGLAVKSQIANITNNNIFALGENLGNSSSADLFAAVTAGINLQGMIAIVNKNLIVSNSVGILDEAGIAVIRENEIAVEDNGLDDSYAIFAEGSNVAINSNDINYIGATNGSTVNNAVCIKDCEYAYIINNTINASIPSCYVDWKEEPAGSGIWVKYPVSEGIVVNGSPKLRLEDNNISVEANSVVGFYDTIYALDIKNSPNANVSNNNIAASGHDYIYGLYIESDNATVDNNKFVIESDTNYANAIEIEASVNATISNNDIKVTSPKVAYAVYSGMNGGDLEVDYIGNTINATSDIVYGMELCGTNEYLSENKIEVNGNKTTALAIKSEEVEIAHNIIGALGKNLGNSTTTDSFAPMTAAIHLMSSDAAIHSNEITSSSRGILFENGEAALENNFIIIKNNGLDDSYAIMAENTDISISGNDIVYEGNGNGSKKNRVVYLKDCIGPELTDNYFNISLPSCYVDWKEEPAGSGNWVSDPMSEGILIDSPNAIVKHNNILSVYEGVFGDYDTIYVLHVNSDNAEISSNVIRAYGHSYIYGLEVSGNNFTVDDNSIFVSSDEFYANGIDIEGPASGIVSNNEIVCLAHGVTYPVYSAMTNGNVTVDYMDNEITSEADLAYGMELGGISENVEGNIIDIVAKEGIGIYSRSQNVTVNNNTINIDSSDDNVTTSTAFKGGSGNATITNNNFTVNGEYTVDVAKIAALVKDNYLVATNLTGDASVNYDPETSSVYNNTPEMEKYFIVSDGLEKYYGNDKALEFRLIDVSGQGVANETVTIVINGRPYNRTTDANGTVSININLNSGNYTITATCGNVSGDAEVIILPTIEGQDITKVFRNATQYEATFLDTDGNVLNNTEVIFNINGVMYKRITNANGIARLNINLPQGKYIITAINPVNSEMHANNITVLSLIAENADLTKYYKNTSQYVVRIIGADGNPVKAGEVVTFNINGVLYNRTTNASGHVKLNINLRPGDYVITASYKGCSVANNITVLKTIETKDLSMKYRDGSKFEAKVLDGQGKPLGGQTVQFNINGVLYDRVSEEDGIARLNVNLMPGKYIITSTYNGYGASNTITIKS